MQTPSTPPTELPAPAERHRHGATPLETHFRRRHAKRALWGGMAAGPLAAIANLHVVIAGATPACRGGVEWPLHLATAAMLAVALAGTAVAAREWRRAGREWPGEGGTVVARSRFLGAVGTMTSGFFSFVILAQWMSLLFVQPCWGM
jgi:hypothetical protein